MVPSQISLDLINTVRSAKQVYYHSNCPDGIMSREFIMYLMSDGKNVPIHEDVRFIPFNPGEIVPVEPNTVFIDVSPVAEQWEEFLKAGCIILDHHNTMLPLFDKYRECYPEQLVFGDTAAVESGAWLGFKLLEVWSTHQGWVTGIGSIQTIAKLIAIGDCWDTSDLERFEKARYLGLYIKLYGNDYDLGIPGRAFIDQAVEYGKLCKKQTARLAKRHMSVVCGNLNVAFFNSAEAISDIAEIMRNEHNTDLIVSWYSHCLLLDGVPTNVTQFSLRSNDKFDVGAFAQFVSPKGGGHKKAAGFQVKGVINGMDYVVEALKWFGLKP